MVTIGKKIAISLIPQNEAEFPEIVEVEILQQLPIKDKNIYIAKLITQPKQDFGYHVGELLSVRVRYEDEQMVAFCEGALQKE